MLSIGTKIAFRDLGRSPSFAWMPCSARSCVTHNIGRTFIALFGALTRRFPYEVFFLEDDERVVVLSVFHAKRNPKRWQERI